MSPGGAFSRRRGKRAVGPESHTPASTGRALVRRCIERRWALIISSSGGGSGVSRAGAGGEAPWVASRGIQRMGGGGRRSGGEMVGRHHPRRGCATPREEHLSPPPMVVVDATEAEECR
jgi:hypothetical protein